MFHAGAVSRSCLFAGFVVTAAFLSASSQKSPQAEEENRQRGELVSAHNPENPRGVAEEFMKKTERPAGHEVEVEMLAGQEFF